MVDQIIISMDWNEEGVKEVRRNLIEYNMSQVLEHTRQAISENVSILLKGDNDTILGGIVGQIYYHCLSIDLFWIDEKLRGKGYGKELMTAAEELALNKGCKLIKLDTLSFQAPEFYEKLGYLEYGKLDNFPEGFSHHFFYKRMD
ncbi:GNAT family N-acetyltransferase [Fictibacillus aquaticus]|uniref:GNAT family N-acetyltransferase n=1 Tax=Fictibacillus aquaticus TaxID=2021314 RepID=A0A235F7B4_9BACL|nr:GNAT family N-acetyltransferase [Fictibacillus aquaticus]OYD57190.1 GNAT family N-acetyltransferase [Fictibacillus aquaticus]